MSNCTLCPFDCKKDRSSSFGRCRSSDKIHIVRALPHFGEEPCISGKNGSGTVFFSGCALRCVFCQNYEISREERGKAFSVSEFANFLTEYSKSGVDNINLVTPSHYSDKIAEVLFFAKPDIHVPIIWNSSGYEKPETLKKLSGLVDVYLMDSKYYSPEVSFRYSGVKDYFDVNFAALKEAFLQQPENVYGENGMIKKGVIVRHLVLPSNTRDSRKLLAALKENFSEKITVSLMCQYVPEGNAKNFPEINRRLRRREFSVVSDCLLSLGFENGYIQQFSSADEKYIPDFSRVRIFGCGE